MRAESGTETRSRRTRRRSRRGNQRAASPSRLPRWLVRPAPPAETDGGGRCGDLRDPSSAQKLRLWHNGQLEAHYLGSFAEWTRVVSGLMSVIRKRDA